MTSIISQDQIRRAVSELLDLARELTLNSISNNCKFIVTEIKDSQDNVQQRRKLNKKMNDRKIPVTLPEIIPTILVLYDNIYDINLQVYRVTKDITVIDFRYYPKSSLDQEYREQVLYNPPMIHCKVSMPPWLTNKNVKFDINWEHYEGMSQLSLFLMKLKLKIKSD